MPIAPREESGLTAGAAAARRAAASPSIFDVAVIGAGVFGVWSAEKLKQAGLSVVVIDAYGPANARASSAGESRVTRLSYGGDPLYSEMARRSLVDWDALSRRTGTPILYRTGVLWFSPADDVYMAKSLAYLEETGTTHRSFTAEALRGAYPQMRFADGERGFLEIESGALIAGRAVQAVIALNEIPVRIGRADPPKKARGGYEPLPGLCARRLVYAAGPWLAKLFPELLAGRIAPTRQEVMHFGTPAGDRRFEAEALPVWADFNQGDLVYGFPNLEGQGFKIAFDAHGEEVDPDTQDRRVSAASIDRARAYLARRFPDLADQPFVHGRVCQYENSSNGDFLIDRHPAFDDVWLVGGGSGHGFKHGPAVGATVADYVLDQAKTVDPRFSLASKDTVRKRTIY
jgi:glycine/D-amino acid oxidase-like deaminating enzyme